MRQLLLIVPAFAFLLLAFPAAKGQTIVLRSSEADRLQSLVTDYCNYYHYVDRKVDAQTTSVTSEKGFYNLFENANILLPRDLPFDDGSRYHLLSNYTSLLQENIEDGKISCISVSAGEALYCKRSRYWNVWITKREGCDNQKGKIWSSIVVLQIVKNNIGDFKIRSVSLAEALPQDKDRDRIADSCDDCPRSITSNQINYISLNGCDAADEDRDGLPVDRDECPCVRGPRSNRGCPYPPSSRIGISLSAGTLMSVDGNFNNRDVVSGSTWDSSGHFAQLGFALDLAFRYNINRWSGLSGGLLFINKKFNGNHFANQVRYFLGKNNVIAENVTVSSKAYQFFVPYVGLRIGDFRSEKSSISIEPIAGIAYTDLSMLGNGTDLHINYLDSSGGNQGENFPTLSINFKAKPFPMYGVKVNCEITLAESRARFIAGLYYLSGHYEFDRREVYFAGTPNSLVFRGTHLQLLGATLGLNINLQVPKHYGGPIVRSNRCH